MGRQVQSRQLQAQPPCALRHYKFQTTFRWTVPRVLATHNRCCNAQGLAAASSL